MNVGEVVKVVEHFAMERQREIAELLQNLKMADARTEEQVRDKTRIANEYEEMTRSLREQRDGLREQVATLTRERDAARELCRRFRNVMTSGELKSLQNEYDATFSDKPAPAEDTTGELVPWTAETRPRGVILIRLIGQPEYEWIVTSWRPDGCEDTEDGINTWIDALYELEWSRDGITWQRCGTLRAMEAGVPQ